MGTDIDNIPFGEDFRCHIAKVLQTTDVLIALIGPLWLAEKDGISRLQDKTDPVRVELELALTSNLVILPVLVGGAAMPAAAELPDSLQAFALRNAAEVESGRDFPHHMERLVRSIDEIFDGRGRGGMGRKRSSVARPFSRVREKVALAERESDKGASEVPRSERLEPGAETGGTIPRHRPHHCKDAEEAT